MRFKKHHIFLLIILVHALGLIIYYNSERYSKLAYLLPISTTFFYVITLVFSERLIIRKNNHFIIWKEYFQYYFLLLFIILLQSSLAFFFTVNFHSRFVKEIMFLAFPVLSVFVLTFFSRSENNDNYVKFLFWSVIVAFVIEKGSSLFNVLEFNLVDALIHSEFSAESGLAFQIGLFSFYFLFVKEKKLFLISLFFVFISGKRTVIGAFLLCIIVYFFIRIFRIKIEKYRLGLALLFLIANSIILYFAYQLAMGTFDEYIITNTGIPPDSFTKGRRVLWYLIFDKFNVNLLGAGLGSITDYLSNEVNYKLINPQNDVLKTLIDQGIIVFVIFFSTFFYINIRNTNSLIMVIYINILFLTTNVLVYFFFMFNFYIIQTVLLQNHLKHKQTKYVTQ